MKTHAITLVAALTAGLTLAGCGQSEKTGAATTATPSAAAATPAQGRPIEITANDAMKFNMTEIRAKAGEVLSVTLSNIGSTPKFSMGHNWILVKPDTDLLAFVTTAATAAAKDYKPDELKGSIIAATRLLGPREHDTVTFTVPSQPGSYPFLCSFPGHFQVGMKGVLIVE